MNKIIKYILASAVIMTAGCSDNDKWTPGEPDSADNPAVYFPNQPSYSYTFLGEEDCKVTVLLKRNNTESEKTVPVIVTTDAEGMTGPSEIHFDAGQRTAEMVYDFNECAKKRTYTLDLAIPADMASAYAAGNPNLVVTVAVAGSWEHCCDIAMDTKGVWDTLYTTLDYLEGTNKFRFNNFLNSGLDVQVEVTPDEGEEGWGGYMRVKPLTNFIWTGDAYNYYDPYERWYLYDTAEDYFPYVYPGGEDQIGIEYCEIDTQIWFDYGSSKSRINYINFAEKSGKFCTYTYYTDGNSGYLYLNYTMSNFSYNPAEQ